MSNEHRQQQITLPGLSFKTLEIVYIKILSELHKSDRVDSSDDKKEPATTCRVLNLKDKKEYILICPALMVSSFLDRGVDYLDKCYEVQVTGKVLPGKPYKGVEVYQIDCNQDYSSYPDLIDDGSETGQAAG